MVDRPYSARFINMISNDVISGTIPRDNETRPHVQVSYDDQDLRGQGNNNTKCIGMIGTALSGKPNTVYKITSLNQAKAIFKGGDLLDAIELAWQPNNAAYGLNGAVYAERAENATPATLNAGALKFVSRDYGSKANDVQIKLTQSDLNNTWSVQVVNKADDYNRTYSNLGLLAHIQYIPNSWTKYNMPKDAKDYAYASYEIKPRIYTRTINGKHIREESGHAGELVLRIHDTKKPAILHNNITNNIDGGSTVYENDGSEYDVKTPASEGDPNPDAGPFVDTVKTFDLTNPKYRSVYDLFNELQTFPNISVEAVDEHNVAHIPTYLLDLTEQAVPMMANLDGTTQNDKGDIVQPAGIWSTLGDIVDKMGSDNEVKVSANLSRQLNFVSTKATGATARLLQSSANDLLSRGSSAQSADSNNTASADNASHAGDNSIASEYASAANSERDASNKYYTKASSLMSEANSLISHDEANATANDKSASAVVSSASAETKKDTAALNTLNSSIHSLTAQKNDPNAVLKTNKSLSSEVASNNTRQSEYASYAESTTAEYSKDISYYNSAAKANNSLASTAKNASSASSYASMAKVYSSEAIDQGKPAKSFANVANTHKAKVNSLMKSARSTFEKSVNAQLDKDNKAANDLKAKLDNAHKVAQKATKDALSHDKNYGMSNNMQKVKNYVGNLIAQAVKALDDGALNYLDSDIYELAHVAKLLRRNKPVAQNQAGRIMGDKLLKAQSDRHNLMTEPKAAKQLPKDLVPVKNAVDKVPSDQPAPQKLFDNDMGDGEINVLGEPIRAFNFTSLTGGYTYPVPYSWESKFHKFDAAPVYDFVVLTPSPAIQQELGAYIQDRYYSDHNMRGFVGADFREPVQQLINRASDLSDERLYLIGSSLVYPMQDGRKLDCPGYMVAALVAGIDASIPVGASILNRKVGASKLDSNYTSTELDVLDQNGVIAVEPVINRGTTSEFVVGDDISTDNDPSDPVKAELQLGEVTDFLFDDLRSYLQKYLGTEINGASHSTLENAVTDFLDKEKASASAGDAGLIIDYNPDDVACEIVGETAYIAFSCAPVRTLKHIFVKGAYNGYDEQYGNGTRQGNFFVGADGRLVNDSGNSVANSSFGAGNPDGTEEDNEASGNDAGGADGEQGQNEESPD